MVGHGYTPLLLPVLLLEVVVIINLVVLNTATILRGQLSIRHILCYIVSVVRGTVQILALSIYPRNDSVTYAGGALIKVDMVNVAVD